MANRFFQTGSIEARFLKLARFLWLNIGKSIKLSLTGICKVGKQALHWLMRVDWLKLLKTIRLVIEIIKKTRSLLFCDQTAHFVQVAG